MTKIAALATAMSFAMALAGATSAQAQCGRYGGWGIGLSESIASFMSNKAAHQALDRDSAKPIAPIKTECNTNAVVYVQCHSTTKACAK